MIVKNYKGEIIVLITSRESTCAECGEELGPSSLSTPAKDNGALCLECADLGHLVFLPAGIAALTRRAKKSSKLHAVVFKKSRKRRRYERQGLLVEKSALEQTETEHLSDADGYMWHKLLGIDMTSAKHPKEMQSAW